MKEKEKRRGRGRRRREEEKEEDQAKVWNFDFCMELTLGMDSIMDHMNFVWDSRKVYEFQI